MPLDKTKLAARVAELLNTLGRTRTECQQTASKLMRATGANHKQLLGVLRGLQTKLAEVDKMLAAVQKQLDQQTTDKVTE